MALFDVKNITKQQLQSLIDNKVFENIWEMDNYRELIQIAYDNMLGDCFGFMVEHEGAAIFANSQETSEFIKKRKKEILKYLSLYRCLQVLRLGVVVKCPLLKRRLIF